MTLNDIYHMLDPVALSVGPLTIRWYGLAYLFGFILTGIVVYRRAHKWGLEISADDVMSVIVGLAFGLIIGARIFYCVFYGDGYYLEHPLKVFALNEGGMSFHGGLVGGIVGAYLACRSCKLSFLTLADLTVQGAPLGLFLGRCANFVNGELWGKETTLPWGVVFETGGNVARHPSQLYEAILEGLVIFFVLLALSRARVAPKGAIGKKGRPAPLPQGTFLGAFLVLYAIFRFLIEFVRVPDEQLGYLAGWLTMGQLLTIPVAIAGVVVLLVARSKARPQVTYLDRGGRKKTKR